jgi:hypothetical protein
LLEAVGEKFSDPTAKDLVQLFVAKCPHRFDVWRGIIVCLTRIIKDGL